jgi:RTX calcium-binding nonapeptide repeat (4 copies)
MATNISNIVFQNGANLPAVNLVNGDTLNLFPTGLVVASGTGTSPGVLAAGSNIFNIGGDIFSFESIGINSTGGGNVFNIVATATIFGFANGISVAGAGNVLTNAGDIGGLTSAVNFAAGSTTFSNAGNIRSASSDAVVIQGGNNSLTNTGFIEANNSGGDALQINGDNNTVINTGTLRGSGAVDFDGPGGVNALFNAGMMIGLAQEGYDGNEGQDFITNNGFIQGAAAAVDMMGGNDVYDGRGGTVSGAILGGNGNDIIFGGAGGENIQGGAGNDLLIGGGGGDILRGGLDADLYIFNVGDNGDLIEQFNEGGIRDGLDLRGYFDATGFTGNNPRAAGILQVLQNGADTDVYLYSAFAFRLQGITAAAIDDSYFLFQ